MFLEDKLTEPNTNGCLFCTQQSFTVARAHIRCKENISSAAAEIHSQCCSSWSSTFITLVGNVNFIDKARVVRHGVVFSTFSPVFLLLIFNSSLVLNKTVVSFFNPQNAVTALDYYDNN